MWSNKSKPSPRDRELSQGDGIFPTDSGRMGRHVRIEHRIGRPIGRGVAVTVNDDGDVVIYLDARLEQDEHEAIYTRIVEAIRRD